MTPRLRFHVAMFLIALAMAATQLHAQIGPGARMRRSLEQPPDQANQTPSPEPMPVPTNYPAGTMSGVLYKPSPSVPMPPTQQPTQQTSGPLPHSLLDEPAAPAQIELSADSLTINAANASLSEVLRKVAADSGMQVEGNTRDERVFGVYGPGKPEDVLSALLYDSGYNMIMVGSTADGAPRKLVLSSRTAASPVQTTFAARSNEEDEEESPMEPPQQPSPVPMMQTTPGIPGQPRTPQQMLEELQRMRQGQQAPEAPQN